MKKIRTIIIFILIAVIILIGLIVVLLKLENNENNNQNEITTTEEVEKKEEYNDTSMKQVKDAQKFYTIRSILVGYTSNILDGKVDYLISQLYTGYISEFNITKDNVIDNVNDIIDKKNYENVSALSWEISEMYYIQKSENIEIYFIRGSLLDGIDISKTDFELVVYVDISNKTYYILPYQYIEKHGLSEKQEDLNKYNFDIEDIPVSGHNSYAQASVDDKTIILDYIKRFKTDILFDLDGSYNLFSEEYRNLKFGNLEGYRKYINDNMVKIQRLSITGYQKIEDDDVIRYILKDDSDNLYVFEEKAIMDFDIYLDTYTIDMPEFIEKYEASTAQTRVGMNLEKVFDAINAQDYKYVYGKLNQDFKNNNYQTEEVFENFVKENLFENNKVEYQDFSKTSDVYTYKVKVTDNTGSSDKVVNLNIVMKLDEGTNFEMSFTVE